MRIGILGAGNIAGVLADTMNKMQEVELYAVASRDLAKAKAFADRFEIANAYGSYEEMVKDENVELVYIATPHSHHFQHMKLCIENHKPVLCEKAFTFTAEEAMEIKKLVTEHKVYTAEAIWTRYMPSRKLIDEVLASGIVGEISMVTCNLSYDIDKVERIMKPELAGGALLDVGVYGLNFITMHLGKEIDHIDTSVVMTDTGVDGRESITVVFENGLMAVSTHGIYGRSDRKGIFYGEKGYIIVENINNPQAIDVFDSEDNLLKHIDVPEQISGYEYEISEAIENIKKGNIESQSMPLDESIYMMQLMDGIREQFSKR
ncbi:MAG: Gfo/Idh/MocA family oxidoreductase [Lachnospiraceae bacterium]|nr:Gfo/Idh/MocA family oxidoreductase [Lachnospiraceae bacterium]